MFRAMKGIGISKKPSKTVSWHSQSFVRPHLNYDDMIYDQSNN